MYAGTNVNLNISSISLTLTSLDTNQIIASHEMPRISFASGGDADTLDFVGYIAKDENELRACYVLECEGDWRKMLLLPSAKPLSYDFSSGDVDKDYYNDLPGKVPPDVEPPPVPPLPTVVLPFTTLPPVQSPNLIDLSSELGSEASHEAAQHEYSITSSPGNIEEEIWFHGQISRAEAETLLQKDGDFLVRESANTVERQFVLSGIQDGNKKHLLLIDPEGWCGRKTKSSPISAI
nr:unnamed protein product [Callosobruchus chinensis]